MDETFVLEIGKVGRDLSVHNAPDDVGSLSQHANLALPFAIANLTAGDPSTNVRSSAVAAEEVF